MDRDGQSHISSLLTRNEAFHGAANATGGVVGADADGLRTYDPNPTRTVVIAQDASVGSIASAGSEAAMSPLLAALPIILLVAAMTVRAPKFRLPMPAHLALPGAALLALLLQAIAGPTGTGPIVIAARIIEGLLTSLMPLAIVLGAILLFRTLTSSGAMKAITVRLERAVPDPVLRVVLIAWSFSYLVEGLSGFGTPAALAAPLLVGLGFPPVRAAAACLVMNTVPVVFGAVGMPIWFGLGEIGMSSEQLRSVATSAAVVQCAAAPIVVALALRLLFPWREVRARAFPIGAIIVATVGASTATALFSTEFPTIVGGVCGLAAAFAIGKFVGGGEGSGEPMTDRVPKPSIPLWRAAFPLGATVVLLAVTRIEPLGLRGLLNAESPSVAIDLGALGDASISASLVARLDDILGTGISWSMALLYVPFIIPFIVVVLMSAPLLRLSARRTIEVASSAARSLVLPAAALAGALVFVKLMMHGGEAAPVVAIGRALADGVAIIYGPLWLGAAPLVGALGSFFSGSATVSNLTFAPVQVEIAEQLGLDTARVLALQAIGAAMGNMVCVHNIVAVAAVLGLASGRREKTEGQPDAAPVNGGGPRAFATAPDDATASTVASAEADASSASSSPDEAVDDPVAAILRLNALPLAAFAIVAAVAAAVLAII